MEIEFDNYKNNANCKKHGIDFKQAQQLWNDPDCIIMRVRIPDEPRFLLISKYDCKIWSAIFTTRNEKVRIILVRMSRNNEEEIYQS